MKKTILLILAAGCVLYYCSMFVYNTGFRISQQYLWLMIAAVLVIWAMLPQLHLPEKLVTAVNTVMWAGLILVAAVEGFVLWGMAKQPEQPPDVLIVLGAGVNGTVPSHSLQLRLEKTLELMEETPELTAVVTGGQGAGEDMTEALCMKQWLTERGIAEERIRMEDRSTSTAENFRFGLPMLEQQDATVGVVTNNFHVFRSMCIAEKVSGELGIETAFVGIAAPYPSLLLPHFMVREFCTLVVDTLRGNLAWPY